MNYTRPVLNTLISRFKDKRRFIQVLMGPRQVGKTTLAQQLMAQIKETSHYATADEPALKDQGWIEQQWEIGRLRAKEAAMSGSILILDEIQKIPSWSETVKKLWDEDSRNNINLKVLVLGSSTLLMQQGLAESLAGRFEVLRISHWSYLEMSEAFGWDVEQYIYFGGYPGAASLINDQVRWSHYIRDALIETTISRDILQMRRVDKPALLRRLFELGISYSGQILSYQKMMGQLQDAGNTTTLAHYLELLDHAGILTGLSKYSGKKIRQRASSPKFQVRNTAFMAALSGIQFGKVKYDPEFWGRLVESSIGAFLVNCQYTMDYELYYWREKNMEVDFILVSREKLVIVEVKSTARKTTLHGIRSFSQQFPVYKKLLVGAQGISIQEFLSIEPQSWFE